MLRIAKIGIVLPQAITVSNDFIVWAVVTIVAAISIYSLWRQRSHVPPETHEARLNRRVEDLESTVKILLADNREDKIKIDALEKKLDIANDRIRDLEARLLRYEPSKPVDDPEFAVRDRRPAKPLLLCQCNKLFGEDDALAIRRVGIPFQRLQECTGEKFDRYLQAARQDGTTPWWLQISAHMGAEGIMFADGVKSATWLSQRIRGIRILLLAGCENEEVAAQLVGLAKHVVIVYETIESQNAQDFSFSFWREIAGKAEPPDAFARALQDCPQVSEFVQMRSARM